MNADMRGITFIGRGWTRAIADFYNQWDADERGQARVYFIEKDQI